MTSLLRPTAAIITGLPTDLLRPTSATTTGLPTEHYLSSIMLTLFLGIPEILDVSQLMTMTRTASNTPQIHMGGSTITQVHRNIFNAFLKALLYIMYILLSSSFLLY